MMPTLTTLNQRGRRGTYVTYEYAAAIGPEAQPQGWRRKGSSPAWSGGPTAVLPWIRPISTLHELAEINESNQTDANVGQNNVVQERKNFKGSDPNVTNLLGKVGHGLEPHNIKQAIEKQ